MSLLILGLHGVMGEIRSDVDLSYLSDTVVQLRFFEAQWRGPSGNIGHQDADRCGTKGRSGSFRSAASGLQLGRTAQRIFMGVLTGVPTFSGEVGTLMASAVAIW